MATTRRGFGGVGASSAVSSSAASSAKSSAAASSSNALGFGERTSQAPVSTRMPSHASSGPVMWALPSGRSAVTCVHSRVSAAPTLLTGARASPSRAAGGISNTTLKSPSPVRPLVRARSTQAPSGPERRVASRVSSSVTRSTSSVGSW